MNVNEMYPGQKVRFLQWNDMPASDDINGLNSYKNTGSCVFVRQMKPLCGLEVVVKRMPYAERDGLEGYADRVVLTYSSDRNIKILTGQTWTYCAGMFEPVDKPLEANIDEAELMKMLET